MAYPRVFISSTCYDLKEVRDTIFSFIEEMNYIPVLSDKGDVFYHPDIHTHDSCIHEIETCQLFILIIGGRFGGTYKANPDKSIVNAEYEAARKLDIPIVTFILREVFEDHRLYAKNRALNKEKYKEIIYPSIEKQSYAINIFEFIDAVRKSEYNNAVFAFEFGRDIRQILKQQWAGMFYDFLRIRKSNKQIEKTNNLLSDLALIGEKTEEILGKIYKSVDEKNAPIEIKNIETKNNAKKLLLSLSKTFLDFRIPKEKMKFYMNFDKKTTLDTFLVSTGDFKRIKDSIRFKENTELDQHFISLIYNGSISFGYLKIEGDLYSRDKKLLENLKSYFEDYKTLNKEELEEVLSAFNL